MNKYIGVKLIEAEPMTDVDFEKSKSHIVLPDREPREGYMVKYPDGYVSWSPKDVFERAYFRIGDKNTIEEHNVNDFIKAYDTSQWGDKTTIVNATLANGFIVTEASSCVDPVNFDIGIGENICREKIQNRVWQFLGFLLQCGLNGVKGKE